MPIIRTRLIVSLLGAVVVVTVGCATAPPVIAVDELRIVAEPVGPDALEIYDAETLFLRGLDLLDGGAWADAADYFDRLVREFPDDDHVLLSHYNRGLAYIHLARGDDAVLAFDAYLAMLPETALEKDRLDGRFKRGQALAVARRYVEVVAVFDEMLGEDLAPDDRVEALVDAGVGHYMLGLLPGGEQEHRPTAEYRFLEARRILKKEAPSRRMSHMQFFQAQSAFYLAELAHIEFTYVLVSPRLRARQTCALAGLAAASAVEPDLAEWNYGDYEGLRSDDICKTRSGWNVWRDGCPHGESPADVAARADRLIERLCTLQGKVLLFSHGQFGTALAVRWMDLPLEAGQHFELHAASLSVLGYAQHHPQTRVMTLWNEALVLPSQS